MTQVKAICKNNCGFEEMFEPCEFGLTYFQTEGKCPSCDAQTVYENGKPTAEVIRFNLTDEYSEFLHLISLGFRDATQENRFQELKLKYPME